MRAYKNHFLIGVLLIATASGCSKSANDSSDHSDPAPATAMTTVNTICPIEGGEVNPELSTLWNGKTVGFCCAPCLPVWNELSEEEKQASWPLPVPKPPLIMLKKRNRQMLPKQWSSYFASQKKTREALL